jgi:hypothetical protein
VESLRQSPDEVDRIYGKGAEQQLTESAELITPHVWAPDGRIVYQKRAVGGTTIWASVPATPATNAANTSIKRWWRILAPP